MVEKYKITKKEEVYNLLKDKRNFQYMSESLLRRLINEMKVVRFTQKTLLMKQDTENRFIYIIIRGKVTVYLDKKPLYTLRRTGDVFGELSFATHSPSTASIVAEKGLGVMAISFNYLKKLNDIEFGLWLCHVLGEKLIRTSKLKSIRTIENIDELETNTFEKTKSSDTDNGPGAVEVDSALEENGNSDADIEIEDITGVDVDGDEAVAETAAEDIEIEDVSGGPVSEKAATVEAVAGDGEDGPVAEEASKIEKEADNDEDDGEFMDLSFEP